MKDHNSTTNQEIKGQLVAREVIHRCNIMISELGKMASQLDPKESEVFYSLVGGKPDFEEAATQEGWKQTKDGFKHEDEESDAENWQELCEEQNIDYDSYTNEPYEFWIVTDWFGEKLRDQGEIVVKLFDFTVWGRCTTGQAILLDYVISKIAYGMEIMEGQQHEWSTL